MRPSKIKAKLRRNEPVLLTSMAYANPAEYELASLMGFDGLWLDMEHSKVGMETAEGLMRAARVGTTDVMVRVAKGEFLRLGRALEAGAQGILYPRCDNAEEAKQVVAWSKFHPLGHRGADGANADMPYCTMALDQYVKEANEQTFVGVQIEDPNALKNADAMAAVPGVDFLFFGPGDFSIFAGIPAQWTNPIIDNAIKTVAAATKKAGIHWGMPAFNAEWAKKLLDLGARILSHGADIIWVKNGLDDTRKKFGPLGFTFDGRI